MQLSLSVLVKPIQNSVSFHIPWSIQYFEIDILKFYDCVVIENKAREAERIVSQLVDEAERRKEEARDLQREVAGAR